MSTQLTLKLQAYSLNGLSDQTYHSTMSFFSFHCLFRGGRHFYPNCLVVLENGMTAKENIVIKPLSNGESRQLLSRQRDDPENAERLGASMNAARRLMGIREIQ